MSDAMPAPEPEPDDLMAAEADLAQLWKACLTHLQDRLTGPAHRAWLDDTKIVAFDNGTVVLAAPHNLAREQITGRFSEDVRAALAEVTDEEDVRVVVIVAPDADPAPVSDPDPDPPAAAGHPSRPRAPWGPEEFSRPAGDRDGALNDKYTFERFVVGASNRFANAAAFAVAEAPANAYNPLFIYGQAGLGKTHLLHAVGHYTTTLYPHLRCRYVTSEQFTNEFIDAISNGRQVAFQRRYRDVDVLLIDDIQFLQSKERTQEEFFHTFNALHTTDKQIVISSDRPPKEIGHLEERLKTRFKMGLLTDVQPPDLETRLAILRKKSAQEGLMVPADVLDLIATNIKSNIRELEGALIRVIAHASLEGTQVDRQMAQWVLKDLFPDAQDTEIGIGLIQSETADYFRLSVEELCSASRTRQLVNARQIAMYITRELTDLSLPKIGQEFGGRDHTTVMHACKKISALIKERPSVFKQVQELTSRIKAAGRRRQ